jgi:phosphatidate cytidylyltransferase
VSSEETARTTPRADARHRRPSLDGPDPAHPHLADLPALLAPVETPRNPAELSAVARHGRAGRDVRVATAVGLGLGAVVVASLFIYRPVFAVLVAVAVAAGCWELATALRRVDLQVPVVPVMVGAVAIVAGAWFSGQDGLVVALTLTVLLVAAWSLTTGGAGDVRHVLASLFVLAYVPLLGSFAVLLARPDDGDWRVLTFVLLVVCSDFGGFVTGVRFGKHPMAPAISPKKSWEGFAGSVLFGLVGGVAVVVLALDGRWEQGLFLGAAAVVSATLGDLGESTIKRHLGIKDMSSLIPGHGGVMDRLDSLLVTAPVVWVLLTAMLPPTT